MTETTQDLLARLAGFTPGPWWFDPLNNEGGCGREAVILGGGFDIAVLPGSYLKANADAHLIAAAPDLHRIATEQAAEIARLRAERGELAACLFEAIDMLDECSICNTGENFNNPRFNAALAVQP